MCPCKGESNDTMIDSQMRGRFFSILGKYRKVNSLIRKMYRCEWLI
jgi:hypothetical protein